MNKIVNERIIAEMLKEVDNETPYECARRLVENGVIVEEHAHWIDRTQTMCGHEDYQFECSACGWTFWEQYATDFHYCPECGATMDGGVCYEND